MTIRRAAPRAAWTAGSNNATRTPMMLIETSNSTSVNPIRRRAVLDGDVLMVGLEGDRVLAGGVLAAAVHACSSRSWLSSLRRLARRANLAALREEPTVFLQQRFAPTRELLLVFAEVQSMIA